MFRNRAMSNLIILGIIGMIMFYVGNSEFEPGKNSSQPKVEILTDIEPDRVQVLELQRVGQPRLKLNKLEGSWWLTQPVMVHADETPIQRLLEILELKSHSRYDVSEVNLESAGLWPARTVIRFDEIQISLGGTDPLHGYRYVLYDEKVHLVDDHFFHIVTAQYPRFVNRLVVPETVVLEMIETPVVTLTRQGETWAAMPEMKENKLKQVLTAWREAFSRHVVPYQERKESFPVILTASNPKVSVQVDVYYDDATLVMGRKDIGIEYHLPRRMVETLAIAGDGR